MFLPVYQGRPKKLAVCRGLLIVVLTFAASVAGMETFRAGTAAAATQSETCASEAKGPVSADLKSVVCAEFVADLAGIGKLLGLPTLAFTSSLTTPVRLIFSGETSSSSTLFRTKYFAPPYAGLPIDKPCEVSVFPLAYDREDPASGLSSAFKVEIAHEVVHCYQHSVISYDEAVRNGASTVPDWISEGTATYVATLYKGYAETVTPSAWANGWLGTSNKDLRQRSYDAVGWVSLVAHATGNDLTSKMAPAWRAFVQGGPNAFIAALGGDDPAVAKAWGPSIVHMPQWGDVWDTPGIGVPAGAQPSTIVDTLKARDVPYQVAIEPLGAIVDTESLVAKGLVEIGVDSGFASVHDADGHNYLDFTDQTFCMKDSCPDAEVTCPGRPTPLKPEPLTAPFTVAVGGAATPSTFTIENMSPPTAPVALPKTEGPCGQEPGLLPPRAAFSEGEPHLQTLNGASYDFQGAGEYTLVRSDSGAVDVQVRAAPFEDSSSVAFNSAVAMRVVSTDVEVDAGDPAVVLINGKRNPGSLTRPRTLAGGGHLRETTTGDGDDVDVTWPDGSEIDVSASVLGENVTFVPPAPGLDHFSGLLSALANTAKPKNAGSQTFLGGDGHRYIIDPTTRSGFKLLYGPFAASWRITKPASLFTYSKGKSPSTFVKSGFPAKLVSASLLSSQKRKQAEATCRAAGVTGSTLLNDCEVDVGETGKAALAKATARVQAAASSSPMATPPTPTSPTATAGAHPAGYYFTHPCAVVSVAEVTDLVGPTTLLSARAGPTCAFRPGNSADADAITFSSQSVKLFESVTPGQGGSGPVPLLGHDAFCIVLSPDVSNQAYVVASLGNAGSIQVLMANCAQGTALTKDALARISGL